MSTPSPTTLLTGSNGALGFPVLLHLLQANHTVHAVLRSPQKASQILASGPVTALPQDIRSRLHTAVIPDLLAPTAYDEVFKANKFDYVVHVASPIPNGSPDHEEFLIKPAVQGTLNILEAAEKAGVKRVVITSSVVGMVAMDEFAAPGNDTIYDEKSRTPDPTGPIDDEWLGYRASKIKALNAAERWAHNDGKGRHVEIVHVHPGFVIGGVELAKTKEELLVGSSGMVLGMALGNEPIPRPTPSNTVWLEDVAEVHVRATDATRVPNGQSLVVASEGINGVTWTDGKKIVEKNFPEALKKGLLGNQGWPESAIAKFNVEETERLVGFKFEGFERQIVDVVKQYLHVIGEKSD